MSYAIPHQTSTLLSVSGIQGAAAAANILKNHAFNFCLFYIEKVPTSPTNLYKECILQLLEYSLSSFPVEDSPGCISHCFSSNLHLGKDLCAHHHRVLGSSQNDTCSQLYINQSKGYGYSQSQHQPFCKSYSPCLWKRGLGERPWYFHSTGDGSSIISIILIFGTSTANYTRLIISVQNIQIDQRCANSSISSSQTATLLICHLQLHLVPRSRKPESDFDLKDAMQFMLKFH